MELIDLCYASASTLRDLYLRREVSPVEVVSAVLGRVEEVDPKVNAFVTVLADEAMREARRAESELVRSRPEDLRPLFGVPVTVKDLVDTAGVRTTYGSRHYAEHVPAVDALSWARLKAAGAILIGKTTTPEFGMLGVTESPLTGVTNNPWDLGKTVGGSSGGAAAAVAAGMAPLAWGTDGGGSIRIPASCCGVVGLKASMGRIPVLGECNVYDSVNTGGPMARITSDVAMMLQAVAGPDERDPLSLPASDVDYVAGIRAASVRGLRIATSLDLGTGPVASAVRELFEASVAVFGEGLGAEVDTVRVDLPDPVDYFLSYWSPETAGFIEEMIVEAGYDLRDSHPLLAELAERAHTMSAYDYWHVAVETRGRIAAALAEVFRDHDLLLTPTMPLPPFPHPGPAAGPTEIDGVSVERPAIDFHRLTEPFSHAGLPAISVPCGFTADGLPVGLQIVGRHHDDLGVLVAAAAFEAETGFAQAKPAL